MKKNNQSIEKRLRLEFIVIVLLGILSVATQGLAVDAPTSVEKLTVAVDGWGFDQLNPVETTGPGSFLQDYFNFTLLTKDENNNVVGVLANKWELTDKGAMFSLDPKAMWHDGTPVTAYDIKWNLQAQRGDFAPEWKGHVQAERFKRDIGEIEVIDDHNIFIHTLRPVPDFLAFYASAGYHQVYFGNAKYLKKVGAKGFEQNPSGGGPYKVKEWKPGERIVLERWENFWGHKPWYSKPQARIVEVLLVTDESARYALLKSKQADIVVNISYPIAKDLPRSENKKRGTNPGQGDLWTQTVNATGNMYILYMNLQAIKDAVEKPSAEDMKPFNDDRVREAMELAVDKEAISKYAHFGFTKPMTSLWHTGSFGYRPELKVSPFNPKRAKQLLKDAGYPNGFSTKVYYGPFPNSPGIKEWLEAAASFWKQHLNVDLTIIPVESSEFYGRWLTDPPERPWRPLAVQTWGRQEHAGVLVELGFWEGGGFNCCWDEKTNSLRTQINSTDVAKQNKVFSDIEDHVFQQRWILPMCEVSVVQGYTDRVLSHPTAPYSSHFVDLHRVVLKN